MWGAASDAGRVRAHNEDSLLASPPIFVVADGMGGHSAGEVASQLAVEVFRELGGRDQLSPDDLAHAVHSANAVVRAEGRADHSRAGMGTTVAGLAIVMLGGDVHWCAFNVGDSRVYRYAHDRLTQISVDHSEVQELLMAGRIAREDVAAHPRRNVVTRSLGLERAPEPDIWVFPPAVGERLLVCSDGLTRELQDDEIAQVLRLEQDPVSAAHVLVERAVDAGGRDNVSAIVVEILPDGASDLDASTAPRAGAR